MAPVFRTHLGHGDGARLAARGGGVDQDDGVIALGNVVREMHAADPVISNPDSVGQVHGSQTLGDLRAETIVAEEDVAYSGDQDASCRLRLVTGHAVLTTQLPCLTALPPRRGQ
jgi:hypothetical protein